MHYLLFIRIFSPIFFLTFLLQEAFSVHRKNSFIVNCGDQCFLVAKKKNYISCAWRQFLYKISSNWCAPKKSVTTENNEPKSWTEILILFNFCARKLSQCCSYCTYFSILQKRMQQFLYMRKQCLSLWVGVIMAAVDWHLKAGVAKRCAVTFCDSLLTGEHHTTL